MKNSVSSLVLTLLCITLAVLVALFGINALNIGGVLEEDTISKGLDLVGGSSITFKAVPEENSEISMDDAIEKAINILRKRLDGLNYNEATVAKVGQDQIRIEIPGIENPDEAVKTLGSTAKLVFEDSEGTVVIEGKDIAAADAVYGQARNDSVGSEWYVSLQFNDTAKQAFTDATSRMAAKPDGENYIAIKLDNETISRPSVSETISDTHCSISGSFTEESAKELATLISSGQLPVAFQENELRSVGASLGSEALSTSIFAGAIGILLVMLYMILIYRVPGVVSCISLIAYAAIFAIVLSVTKINLSLPGIAGIIFTIGMAVDSNVIIYERIKEELNLGKTLKAASRAGFERAFTAIFDSNITTLIAAVVLWYYGTGSVQGFAKTLFIGVLISLFTALVITRVLLYALVEFKISPRLFGAKAGHVEE
ncbi:MAG: protein translocase subunit SecD [Clostridiales bacterium]|nr:protein translocase subunit SecD [Clostridiales bacterium]